MSRRFFKLVACEIALREICHVAAQSRNLIDPEFLTQGLHDVPRSGLPRIQERIDAVPPGRYDAILVGYGLCGHLIRGLAARHTPLVIPRAHDCITFFLGSRKRHAQLLDQRPGTYFYTSGWLECRQRRGDATSPDDTLFLPASAGMSGPNQPLLDRWIAKYGEERARYLLGMLDQWAAHYTHGTLIDFDFSQPLHLADRVEEICRRKGWQFDVIPGDLDLLLRWMNGDWSADDFLVVEPGHRVEPSHDDRILQTQPAPPA